MGTLLACTEKNCASDEVSSESVAAFAPADPDCTKVACPKKCTCAEKSCAADLASCLADSSCTSGQACASACACGDNSCLVKCGIMHPSIKAATLLACTEKNCASE